VIAVSLILVVHVYEYIMTRGLIKFNLLYSDSDCMQ